MIVGDYSDYLTLMTDNHIESGKLLSGNAVVLYGYDGAVHVLTINNEIRIVSFSSLVFHKSFYEYGITTATSNIILTLMQSITDESRKALLTLLTPIFERHKLLQATASTTMDDVTFCYYQCHDAKCMYELRSRKLEPT